VFIQRKYNLLAGVSLEVNCGLFDCQFLAAVSITQCIKHEWNREHESTALPSSQSVGSTTLKGALKAFSVSHYGRLTTRLYAARVSG